MRRTRQFLDQKQSLSPFTSTMSNTKDQVQADPKDQVSANNNNNDNNTLGVLEEDDEFEEFTIAGPSRSFIPTSCEI